MKFSGFPRRVRSLPVPSPLFGELLEDIDDLSELKCLLRVIWLLQQKRGYPRYVTLAEAAVGPYARQGAAARTGRGGKRA